MSRALLLSSLVVVLPILAPPASAEEPVSGAAVYKYCVGCHGKQGAGGEDGKYPRIAGLPTAYLERQLHDFRQRRRINKPMVPIFTHHRFNDEVIATTAAHVNAMPVPDLALWPYEPDPSVLAGFPSRSGFAAAGAARYGERCAGCHGVDGQGDASRDAPPLIDQYPGYLIKQINDFATNQRRHGASDQCSALSPVEAETVVNHLVELGKGG